jgi:hypothetical protein
VLLGAVPCRDDRFQTSAIGGAWVHDDILAHPPDSHWKEALGNPLPT